MWPNRKHACHTSCYRLGCQLSRCLPNDDDDDDAIKSILTYSDHSQDLQAGGQTTLWAAMEEEIISFLCVKWIQILDIYLQPFPIVIRAHCLSRKRAFMHIAPNGIMGSSVFSHEVPPSPIFSTPVCLVSSIEPNVTFGARQGVEHQHCNS